MADQAPAPTSEADVLACIEAAGDGWHAGATCIGTFAAAYISGMGAVSSIPVTQCLDAEAQGWNDVLNTVYQSLREALSDPEMLPVAAEALRDVECLSRGNLTKGTGHFEDGAECSLRVTATRTLNLIGYGGGR